MKKRKNIVRAIPFDPATFDPEALLGARVYTKFNEALEEVDIRKVKLRVFSRWASDDIIRGDESIWLDVRFFAYLWKHKAKIPKSWRKKTRGHPTSIFFDGVIQDRYGRRLMICLVWRYGAWDYDWDWVGYKKVECERAAVHYPKAA